MLNKQFIGIKIRYIDDKAEINKGTSDKDNTSTLPQIDIHIHQIS